MEPLRILLASSEIAPFAKTGGLADVAAGLGRYLGGQGHDVRLLMPAYGRIDADRFTFEPHPRLQDMSLELGTHSFPCSVTTSPLPKSEVQVMFLRCPELYGRQEIYSSDSDEHLRFALLSRACLDVCQWLEWSPDVIHCNDWHTGLTPLYLKAGYGWDRLFESTRTVLTIHNLGYQGVFSADTIPALGRCRIRRCASLAGGGLSAARKVAFARGEASIAARCMRHDSRQRVRELLAER